MCAHRFWIRWFSISWANAVMVLSILWLLPNINEKKNGIPGSCQCPLLRKCEPTAGSWPQFHLSVHELNQVSPAAHQERNLLEEWQKARLSCQKNAKTASHETPPKAPDVKYVQWTDSGWPLTYDKTSIPQLTCSGRARGSTPRTPTAAAYPFLDCIRKWARNGLAHRRRKPRAPGLWTHGGCFSSHSQWCSNWHLYRFFRLLLSTKQNSHKIKSALSELFCSSKVITHSSLPQYVFSSKS